MVTVVAEATDDALVLFDYSVEPLKKTHPQLDSWFHRVVVEPSLQRYVYKLELFERDGEPWLRIFRYDTTADGRRYHARVMLQATSGEIITGAAVKEPVELSLENSVVGRKLARALLDREQYGAVDLAAVADTVDPPLVGATPEENVVALKNYVDFLHGIEMPWDEAAHYKRCINSALIYIEQESRSLSSEALKYYLDRVAEFVEKL